MNTDSVPSVVFAKDFEGELILVLLKEENFFFYKKKNL